MKRANLIPLALLCGFLFTGFTQPEVQKKAVTAVAKKAVTDVTLEIILPWSGRYNDWYFTFYDNSGNIYEFHTDDDMWPSGILGTLPAGTYNIDIQSPHFPLGFDIGVCGPNYYHFKARNDGFMWYGAVIEEGTGLQIDEGY